MATRITDRTIFSVTLGRAVQDYLRQIAPDPEAKQKVKWRGGDLDEVAKSAAIQVGLNYDPNVVDPKIVRAIQVLAKNPDVDKSIDVTDAAWSAYRHHFS